MARGKHHQFPGYHGGRSKKGRRLHQFVVRKGKR